MRLCTIRSCLCIDLHWNVVLMRKTIFRKLEAQGLIMNYNHLRKNLPPRLPDKVSVIDDTLREGVQTPTVFLTYVEKVRLAKMLDETGVSILNVGFPGLSEEEKNTVKRIVNEGFQQATLIASARPTKADVDACIECGVREILMITPYNGLNIQFALNTTKEQLLAKTVESIGYAKRHALKVDFLLEDGSRTPIEDILQIYEAAVKAGADRLTMADSAGFLRPLSMRYLLSHVREGLEELKVKEVPMSVDCHNDFGLACANTLAAVEEGASYIHTSAVGFGERAGVAPLEEVVTTLELLYDIDTGLELDRIYRLTQLAEKTFALPIQFHKPIVGDNAFSFETNEHIEGIMANAMTFEPFPPEIVGRETTFYFGRLTGRKVVEERLKQAEIKANPMQIEEIVRRLRHTHEAIDKGEAQMTFYQIKRLMKDLRKGMTDEEFWRLVEQVTHQKPKLEQKQPKPIEKLPV